MIFSLNNCNDALKYILTFTVIFHANDQCNKNSKFVMTNHQNILVLVSSISYEQSHGKCISYGLCFSATTGNTGELVHVTSHDNIIQQGFVSSAIVMKFVLWMQ